MIKIATISCLLFVIFFGSTNSSESDVLVKALESYKKGDYSTTLSLVKSVANQLSSQEFVTHQSSSINYQDMGNTDDSSTTLKPEIARIILGVLYKYGKGVEQNDQKAYNLLKSAGIKNKIITKMENTYISPEELINPKKEGYSAEIEYTYSSGSGFFVSKTGYIITNNHVVNSCYEVVTKYREGYETIKVIARDNKNDLALLYRKYNTNYFYTFSKTSVVKTDFVLVAGYPYADKSDNSPKVTRGIVSSLAGLKNNYAQFQIDAAAQPGNSGGPVISEQSSNVVGILVAQMDKAESFKRDGTIPENANFAIKSKIVRKFLNANSMKLPTPLSKPLKKMNLINLIDEATRQIICINKKPEITSSKKNKKQYKLSSSLTLLMQKLEKLPK